MARKLSGPEHVEQANECLDGLVRARRDSDWPAVTGLAAAAQAHLSMAEFAWQVSSAPVVLAGRQGQQWADAAGVDRPR